MNTRRINKHINVIFGAVIALLIIILLVVVVLLVLTPHTEISSHSAQSAQEAQEQLLKEAEEDGYYDTDPVEVVQLCELIGTNLDTALELIGHGAEIDGEPTSVAGGLSRVEVLLGDESATIDTGMALVYLYLDKSGHVAQASYEINIESLSCSSLPFEQIVNDAHLIERVLIGAGLTSFTPNPITAPEKQDYALYDSSGKTTIEERYEFSGGGTNEKAQNFEWSVLLDYNYEQAVEKNNLAYTVRTVQVSINSANL